MTLSLPAAAGASLGTGVGASPITLARPAMPGHAYELPGLYVLNTGTERSRYHVRVERLSQGKERTLPAGWVVLARNDFLLGPGRSATIPFTITIPQNARSGAYLSDLGRVDQQPPPRRRNRARRGRGDQGRAERW